MNSKSLQEKIYQAVSLIPKGKVATYKQIAKISGVKNPRLVGNYLHKNKNPKKIPCHRVIKNNGLLANGYAFGGIKKQKELLQKEGIKFNKDRADFKKYLFKPVKPLLLYFELLSKFGSPGKWPWFNNGKPHGNDEIPIGAILTQNTNWRNVQKAIDNLRNNRTNNLKSIYKLGRKNISLLKKLMRPSGFYNQKAERLFLFCEYIVKNYQTLEGLSKIPLSEIRDKLLSLKGIGKETADTILLYALHKPIFVIDAYTKRFVLKHKLQKDFDYDSLQNYFMKNLPKNTKLYQYYHALIVKWGKENKKY